MSSACLLPTPTRRQYSELSTSPSKNVALALNTHQPEDVVIIASSGVRTSSDLSSSHQVISFSWSISKYILTSVHICADSTRAPGSKPSKSPAKATPSTRGASACLRRGSSPSQESPIYPLRTTTGIYGYSTNRPRNPSLPSHGHTPKHQERLSIEDPVQA